MRRGGFGSWLTGVGVLVALAALAQVGMVSVQRSGRTAELEHELRELRRESIRTRTILSRRAESARGEAQRLRLTLDQSRRRNDALQVQLAAADSVAGELRNRADGLARSLVKERPFVETRLLPSEERNAVVAVVSNRGSEPVELFELGGMLWLDGVPVEVAAELPPTILEPGFEADVLVYPLTPGAALAPVRGALCLAYERLLEGASSPWVDETWFEVAPHGKRAAVLRRESWSPAPEDIPCELAALPTPWQ